MSIAKIAITRPILTTVILLVFIIFGFLAYFSLPLNMMPSMDIPVAIITTVYEGAGPKEVETQITKKIEDEVATISKIDYMQSWSMENTSLIMVRFKQSKNIDIATQEIKDKIDGIKRNLPDDADPPTVQKYDMEAQPVVELVLSGNLPPAQLYDLASRTIKDRFSQVEGVAKVDISGGQEREIRVQSDNRLLFENKISLAQLANTLAQQNLDMPGGSFKEGSQEYTVRMKGQYANTAEMAQTEIPAADGAKKLGMVAAVVDTTAEVTQRAVYFNNTLHTEDKNVIRLSLVKNSEGNIPAIAKLVKKMLPEIQGDLPNGVHLNLIIDNSTFIKSSFDDTMSNLYMGIILTSLVLLFFLHDLRSTLILALTMPASIVSTFMLLQATDCTLNIMTLMGLSNSIGTLVASSVVVLENIFRHKELGHNRKSSAEVGTNEVLIPVLASALTNIVVFLPVANMTSLVGSIFKEFALTITYATVFSIIISFTLTPMLSSMILPERKHETKLTNFMEGMFERMNSVYRGMLDWVMRNKKSSFFWVVMSVILLVVSFFTAGKHIGFEFMPLMDEGNISLEMELPEGTNLDASLVALEEVQKIVTDHKEVAHTVTTVGKLSDTVIGTNMATMSIKLVEAKDRNITTQAITDKLINELSNVTNAKLRVQAVSSVGTGGAPVEFYLTGTNQDKLNELSAKMMDELKTIPGLNSTSSSARPGKPEITLLPKRDKLNEAGITAYQLATSLRAAVEGLTVTTYRDQSNGNEYDIRVTLNDDQVNDQNKVMNLAIMTAKGPLPVSSLADVQLSRGLNSIEHYNKINAVAFSGTNAQGYALGDIQKAINQKAASMNLPSGYKLIWGGDARMMGEAIIDMLRTLILAILLTYLLLAAIMESWKEPLYILLTLPLALIGVFWGMYLTGQTMNIIAMMSVIMLVGIVVNNAILQLEYAKQLIAEGRRVREALLEACVVKLKPILMSTLAIILGMMPAAMGIGAAGKEFRQTMGIVSIGGLVASTLLALFIIPAIYYVFSREHHHDKSPDVIQEQA